MTKMMIATPSRVMKVLTIRRAIVSASARFLVSNIRGLPAILARPAGRRAQRQETVAFAMEFRSRVGGSVNPWTFEVTAP